MKNRSKKSKFEYTRFHSVPKQMLGLRAYYSSMLCCLADDIARLSKQNSHALKLVVDNSMSMSTLKGWKAVGSNHLITFG